MQSWFKKKNLNCDKGSRTSSACLIAEGLTKSQCHGHCDFVLKRVTFAKLRWLSHHDSVKVRGIQTYTKFFVSRTAPQSKPRQLHLTIILFNSMTVI